MIVALTTSKSRPRPAGRASERQKGNVIVLGAQRSMGRGRSRSHIFRRKQNVNRLEDICHTFLSHLEPSLTSDMFLLARYALWGYKLSLIKFIRLIFMIAQWFAASDGCLQYFTGVSGQILSFNYNGASGLQLSNTDYSACIRMERNFCGIQYNACADNGNQNSFICLKLK